MRNIFQIQNNFEKDAAIQSRLIHGNPTSCENPVVSILMPVYSHPNFFEEALLSALNQDFALPYEIIVADNHPVVDGETEHERIVLRHTDARVLYFRHEKVLHNFNRCIELARASCVTFLHDDDKLNPNALSTLWSLKDGKRAVFSAYDFIDGAGAYIHRHNWPHKKWQVLDLKNVYAYTPFEAFISSVCTGGLGALFNRECLLRLGGFAPEFAPSEDYALCSVYACTYGAVYTNTVTIRYRIAENDSKTQYLHFPDIDRHIRLCLRDKINLPRCLLNRIITANYHVSKISFARTFVKNSAPSTKAAPFTDRLIMKALGKVLAIKKYKLEVPLPFNKQRLFKTRSTMETLGVSRRTRQ